MLLKRITRDIHEDVLEVVEKFHGESQFNEDKFERNHISQYLENFYYADEENETAGAYGFVAYDLEEKPVGIMSFYIAPKLMNSELVAYEEVMYVEDRMRGNGLGGLLVEACEGLATALECTAFFIGSLSGIAAQQTNERLSDYGYHRIGVTFFKGL